MPPVYGNLTTNKFILQEKGPFSTGNLVMEVLNNEFTMSMGSNVLMTVSPDNVPGLNESSDANTVLTIGKDTVIDGSFTVNSNLVVRSDVKIHNELSVGSNIVLNAQISDEMKAAIASICDAGAWQPSYGQSNNFLPFGSNIFTPVASVHVWKNGDEWEYNAGKLNGSTTSPDVDSDTIYTWYSMTKTITALLYARLKTIGVIPAGHAVKLSDVFPIMKDITYAVPSFSSTSNATTLCADPNDGSRWVNLTPTTRELYLEDVLSESVGFAGTDNFENTYFDIPSFGTSNPMAAYNIAASNVYGSSQATAGLYETYVTNPINIVFEPTTNFTNYIAQFSTGGVLANKPCIMYREHGVFNYNSSANIGTAALLQFYRNKYPAASTMSYFDVLKKELLDPVGADLFYYFNSDDDPRFAKVAATWKPAPDNSGYVIDARADTSLPSSQTGSLYRLATYSALFNINNYNGNLGLLGTKAEFSKVIRLLALDGVTTSGVRLINAKEIANLRIPRVSIDELSSALTLYSYFKSYASTYALGGCSRGPSYTSAYTTDPTFQIVENGSLETLGTSVYGQNIGILSTAEAGTTTLEDCAKDEYGWSGASGSICITCAETRTVAIIVTQDELNLMGWHKIVKPIHNVLQNDYFQPSALTHINL